MTTHKCAPSKGPPVHHGDGKRREEVFIFRKLLQTNNRGQRQAEISRTSSDGSHEQSDKG